MTLGEQLARESSQRNMERWFSRKQITERRKYLRMPPGTLEEQLAASIEWAKQRKEETMAEKVKLETNIWAEIALKWTDGKNMVNEYGESVMFSTVDSKVLFVPVPAAEKIRAVKLNPCERLAVRKAEINGANGTRPHVEWQVKRLGEQGDGTFAVEKTGAAGPVNPPTPVGEMAARTTEPPRIHSSNAITQGNGNKLEAALKTVVEACHRARLYAKEIGYEAMPPFTSEDMRCMANTILINGGPK